MKFVEVKDVPGLKVNHRLKDMWDEFMASNMKMAKVNLDEGEYSSVVVAASVMAVSIRRYGYPIRLIRRGDEIYLIRKDI